MGSSPPVCEAPLELTAALNAAERALVAAASFIERRSRSRFDADYERIGRRYDLATFLTAGIWADVRGTGILGDPRARLRAADVPAALEQVEHALDRFDALFQQTTATMRSGLWIGPMSIGPEAVLRAELLQENDIGQPALAIALTPDAGERFSSITGRAIGRYLAVRLDGAIIAKPAVHQRAIAGRVELSGPTLAILTRALAVVIDG